MKYVETWKTKVIIFVLSTFLENECSHLKSEVGTSVFVTDLKETGLLPVSIIMKISSYDCSNFLTNFIHGVHGNHDIWSCCGISNINFHRDCSPSKA